MIPNSSDNGITLNTYEDSKQLQFEEATASGYDSDLHFVLRVASPSVAASTPFQVSEGRLSTFIDGSETGSFSLEDENGDGVVEFEQIDRLGHYRVKISVGGPWSDQARVSFDTDQTAVREFVANWARYQQSAD